MSGIVRFISDLHFNHESMAIRRGFSSVYNHDNYIIENWNSIVDEGDTTWILGDLTMEKSDYNIIDKLKGYKKVVMGNHDLGKHVKELLKYVNSVQGMVKYKDKTYGEIWLTHCPVYPQELEYRVGLNIHGHIHKGYKIPDKRYINVSAEVVDYTPKTLEELLKYKIK